MAHFWNPGMGLTIKMKTVLLSLRRIKINIELIHLTQDPEEYPRVHKKEEESLADSRDCIKYKSKII